MHKALCNDLQPNLTILLLPDLTASLTRARGRNAAAMANENRFEREDDAFYHRIHAAYEAIAARDPQRVSVLRDNSSVEAVAARIHALVATRLTVPA